MKYILSFFAICIISVGFIFFRDGSNKDFSNEYMCINIVSNSTELEDEKITVDIRNNITKYLDNLLKDSKSKNETDRLVYENLNSILRIVNDILINSHKNYGADVFIYDENSKGVGDYSVLKINLGKAEGVEMSSFVNDVSYFRLNENIYKNYVYILEFWETINYIT